jgi:hypothetical protein
LGYVPSTFLWNRRFWTEPIPWSFLPFLGVLIAGSVYARQFQLVQSRTSDWLVPISFGVAGVVLWVTVLQARLRMTSQRNRFAALMLLALFFTHPAFLILNGLLDTSPSTQYEGIITAVACLRSTTWSITGAPHIPTPSNVMQLRAPAQCGHLVGDSVSLVVRQGFFHRVWIASYALHQPDPVQAALRRHRTLIDSIGRERTQQRVAH